MPLAHSSARTAAPARRNRLCAAASGAGRHSRPIGSGGSPRPQRIWLQVSRFVSYHDAIETDPALHSATGQCGRRLADSTRRGPASNATMMPNTAAAHLCHAARVSVRFPARSRSLYWKTYAHPRSVYVFQYGFRNHTRKRTLIGRARRLVRAEHAEHARVPLVLPAQR
jgi:hypothetical protein